MQGERLAKWARLTWLVCPKVEGSPAFDLACLRDNLFLTIPAPSNPTTTHAATGNRFKKFDQVIAQRSVLAGNGRHWPHVGAAEASAPFVRVSHVFISLVFSAPGKAEKYQVLIAMTHA